MSLYSRNSESKHTGLTLDLLSQGNSNQYELKEVIAGAVRAQRVGKFKFKSRFPEGWWRVIIDGVDVAHPLPQPPGCRADTEIACPGSSHRRGADRFKIVIKIEKKIIFFQLFTPTVFLMPPRCQDL